MELLPVDAPRPDPDAPELLTRDARPGEGRALADQLLRLGWCRHDLVAWEAGAQAAVVYDPVDARIWAAGLARQLAPGTFELLVGRVTEDAVDGRALGARLLGAVGDRVRRLGGQRLLAPMATSGLPSEDLVAAGFVSEPTRAGRTGHGREAVGCLEL